MGYSVIVKENVNNLKKKVMTKVSFDDLLGRLNDGLSRTQLVELERLFGRCGSFTSDRKSVMVSRLAREIEIYENYAYIGKKIYGQQCRDGFAPDKMIFCAKLTIEIDKKNLDVCNSCLDKIKIPMIKEIEKNLEAIL